MHYTIGVTSVKGSTIRASREVAVKTRAIESHHKRRRKQVLQHRERWGEGTQHPRSRTREIEGEWEWREKSWACTVVRAESTVGERFYTDGHLDAFFAFAFNHASHSDGRHPQYRLPFRERQLEVLENFDDNGMQFDHPIRSNVSIQNLQLFRNRRAELTRISNRCRYASRRLRGCERMSVQAVMDQGEKRTECQDITINTNSGNAFFFLAVEVPPRVENVGIVSPDFRDTNIAVNAEQRDGGNGTSRLTDYMRKQRR